MKKVLVTVGTSSFDSLLRSIDNLSIKGVEFTIQTGTSTYTVKNHRSFTWIDNITNTFKNYDLIVTHAGAGTIYNLLESGFCFLAVPNLERTDHHQLDICNYLVENGYALICTDVSTIESHVLASLHRENLKEYVKTNFFKTDEILNVIKTRI